jgi:hypothetical protein
MRTRIVGDDLRRSENWRILSPSRIPPTRASCRHVAHCFYTWTVTGSSTWTVTVMATESSTRGWLATMTLRLLVRCNHGRGEGLRCRRSLQAAAPSPPKPPPPLSPPNPPVPCDATMGEEEARQATRRALLLTQPPSHEEQSEEGEERGRRRPAAWL